MGFLQDIFREIKNMLVWWMIVGPWEEALRVRSIPLRPQTVTLLKPGPAWAFPFIDKVYAQDMRKRVSDMPVQTLTTSDGKVLTIKCNLGYKIRNLRKLYDTLLHAEDSLVELVTGYVADYAYQHDSGFTPGELCVAVVDKVNFTQYGLSNVTLMVTDFAYARTLRIIQGGNYYQTGDKLRTDEYTGNGGV